ncbi:MAG: hypothetical protein ACHQET_06980 [Chitinophagales bacterium]
MFYSKLGGFIPENKQKEFEQTYRFALTRFPKACIDYSITRDALDQNVFQITTYWVNPDSLNSFIKSETYMMLTGAFHTLGKLQEQLKGEMYPEGT